jgi:hypothetical protein
MSTDLKTPCEVKECFVCDGTGLMCSLCSESDAACMCDDPALDVCDDCDGSGYFCVEHESPAGDFRKICDAVDERDED